MPHMTVRFGAIVPVPEGANPVEVTNKATLALRTTIVGHLRSLNNPLTMQIGRRFDPSIPGIYLSFLSLQHSIDRVSINALAKSLGTSAMVAHMPDLDDYLVARGSDKSQLAYILKSL